MDTVQARFQKQFAHSISGCHLMRYYVAPGELLHVGNCTQPSIDVFDLNNGEQGEFPDTYELATNGLGGIWRLYIRAAKPRGALLYRFAAGETPAFIVACSTAEPLAAEHHESRRANLQHELNVQEVQRATNLHYSITRELLATMKTIRHTSVSSHKVDLSIRAYRVFKLVESTELPGNVAEKLDQYVRMSRSKFRKVLNLLPAEYRDLGPLPLRAVLQGAKRLADNLSKI